MFLLRVNYLMFQQHVGLFEYFANLEGKLGNQPLTLRFTRWAGSESDAFSFFSSLIKPIVNRELTHVTDPTSKVDIEISSVYGDLTKGSLPSRMFRLFQSKTPGGVPFGPWVNSFNLQPNSLAKVNIFFTGENERPPIGPWDAYLSFDTDPLDGKNAYLPLWWFTCTDLDGARVAPYLGKEITVASMLKPRNSSYKSRPEFCVAFVGKAYPFRLQSLKKISDYKPVDIYGAIARKPIKNKILPAMNYKFIFCFENDLYPGYVTEKVIEGWATGAVPLYWGDDPEGYINPKAVINLKDFSSLDSFLEFVTQVDQSKDLWEKIANEPILLRAPDLSQVNRVLTNALKEFTK